MHDTISQAVTALRQGDVIAYPTEAVYGLGCDPMQAQAVDKILALKQRAVAKGVILIASDWQQLKRFTKPIAQDKLDTVFATWPGPVTWLFPASSHAPSWICGQHATIALRVSAHPVCQKLCQAFGGPIVSTSANPEGLAPAISARAVTTYFPLGVTQIIDAPLGDSQQVSKIIDVESGQVLRG